jgi:hypothetical protein
LAKVQIGFFRTIYTLIIYWKDQVDFGGISNSNCSVEENIAIEIFQQHHNNKKSKEKVMLNSNQISYASLMFAFMLLLFIRILLSSFREL